MKWITCAVSGIAVFFMHSAASADVQAVAAMEEVQRSVYGTPPEGAEAIKRQGDGVVFEESLETLNDSRALVRFIDGSGLAMGSKSKVLVDAFVFDPTKVQGNAVVKITLGTLRYVTGAMPKGGTVIQTPTATLTLRGTDVTVHVHPNGQTDVLVHEGLVENHNVVTGQTTTLVPGQSETDNELGNHDYKGDFTQYGLNNVTSITVAEAAAMLNDITTAAGPETDSEHTDNGHHRGGGNSGNGVGNGGGDGAGGGSNGNGGGGGGGNGGGGGGGGNGGGNGGGGGHGGGGGNGNH